MKAALYALWRMPRLLAVFPIFVYQVTLSPLVGRHCRFTPTCSRYSAAAILRHGVIHGYYLTVKRVLRCNPFNPGGNDPVPK